MELSEPVEASGYNDQNLHIEMPMKVVLRISEHVGSTPYVEAIFPLQGTLNDALDSMLGLFFRKNSVDNVTLDEGWNFHGHGLNFCSDGVESDTCDVFPLMSGKLVTLDQCQLQIGQKYKVTYDWAVYPIIVVDIREPMETDFENFPRKVVQKKKVSKCCRKEKHVRLMKRRFDFASGKACRKRA